MYDHEGLSKSGFALPYKACQKQRRFLGPDDNQVLAYLRPSGGQSARSCHIFNLKWRPTFEGTVKIAEERVGVVKVEVQYIGYVLNPETHLL